MHQMMPRQAPSWDFPTFGVFNFAIILKCFYHGEVGGAIIDITAAAGAIAQGSAAVLWPLEPGSWANLPPLIAEAALGHGQARGTDLPFPYPALQWQKRIKK